MSAARIVQKIPNNPTYAYMVTECLRSLGNRTGSSVPAIKKQLGTQFEMDLDSINQKALTNAIKKGVQAGDFVQIKASYKLNKKRPEPTKKAAASTTKKSSTSTSETGAAAATLKAKKKKVVKKSAKSVSKPKASGTKKSATKASSTTKKTLKPKKVITKKTVVTKVTKVKKAAAAPTKKSSTPKKDKATATPSK